MKLDKERILELLAEADIKWFNSRSGKYSYREHLDFTADYMAKHYEKRSANQTTLQKEAAIRGKRQLARRL